MPLVTGQHGTRPPTADDRGWGPLPVAAPVASDQAARLRSLIEGGGVRKAAAASQPPVRRVEYRPRAAVVSVSSGKGGVGKTNLCVNLSIALADLGRRTTMVDADLGMANADVLCGLSPTRRLDAVLAPGRRAGLREIAVEAPGGFRLVPGAVGIERIANLGPDERARLLAAMGDLEEDSDVVVVDTAAGLGRGVTSLMRSADACLVVATPEPTSITDAYALIKCVVRGGTADAGTLGDQNTVSPVLVVNQVVGEREARAVHARLGAVCERFLSYRLPLLGWVSQDARLAAAVRARRPVLLESPSSPASRDFRALALSLVRALRPVGASEPVHRYRGGLKRVLSALMLRCG